MTTCRNDFERQRISFIRRFAKDESGAILVLFTMLFALLMIVVGLAMETAMTEYTRTKIQQTTDTASLAAADLEQSIDPQTVVEDFFLKAGLEDSLEEVVITETASGRTVTVTAETELDALLTRLAGRETWKVSVVGAANQDRGDIEIAVALDNSTSMSWAPGATSGPPSSPSRMDLLIPAAEAFVDAVQPQPGEQGSTTISLVPFATQVSLGADMINLFNVTSEHTTSHCITFGSGADFDTTAVSTTALLPRTAHHDPVSSSDYGWDLNPDWVTCPTDPARNILPWSENTGILKGKIAAMEPYGYTSIELATKWAVALLDPSLQPVLSSLSSVAGYGYLSEAANRGTPQSYSDTNVAKYLIVMSDGANTRNWDIKAPYRTGLSPLYRRGGANNYVYYRNRRFTSRDYYHVSTDSWRSTPGSGAVRMTWQEVWADMPVEKFVEDIKSEADSSQSDTAFFNEIVQTVQSSTKNGRTEDICQAAKDRGIVVFTIGMDTYGQGDATLADCASSESHFYDVNGLDIGAAFASIARQINQLRLIQ